MYKKAIPVFMRSLTSTHMGCGSDLGIVDLPIQREVHTGYPKIESSGLKGCIREYFEMMAADTLDEINVHKIFGYDKASIYHHSENGTIKKLFQDGTQYAGALGFTDARILLFPVKSIRGVFAWATCPDVLNRFAETLQISGRTKDAEIFTYGTKVASTQARHALSSALVTKSADKKGSKIILEEYMFDAAADEAVDQMADYLEKQLNISNLKQRMIIVNDDDFKDFVTVNTEVLTRTKINNATGTVQDGALFTEEYLPSETIMTTLALFSPTFLPEKKDVDERLKNITADEVIQLFCDKIPDGETMIQIGAGATIGKGLTSVTFDKGALK